MQVRGWIARMGEDEEAEGNRCSPCSCQQPTASLSIMWRIRGQFWALSASSTYTDYLPCCQSWDYLDPLQADGLKKYLKIPKHLKKKYTVSFPTCSLEFQRTIFASFLAVESPLELMRWFEVRC